MFPILQSGIVETVSRLWEWSRHCKFHSRSPLPVAPLPSGRQDLSAANIGLKTPSREGKNNQNKLKLFIRRQNPGLWPGSSPTDPQTPKNSKTRKSDSKVTFGVPVKVTQKLLKSDSKVTKTVEKVTFESLLSNFWVTFTGTPKVTFESLFRVFEFFRGLGVCRATSGSQIQGPCWGHGNPLLGTFWTNVLRPTQGGLEWLEVA